MEQGNYTTEKRKWKQLSEKDRYKIEALFGQGLTPAQIGNNLDPKRDRRTIEREIKRGLTEQRDSQWRERMVYLADAGQHKHDENAANKGRGLKIGHDHKLAEHIEKKIIEEKYSPDAVIGEIKEKSLEFETTICTKTVYNMIDRGDFLNLTNKDLPVKKDGKKRGCKRVRKVALNNTKGRIIEERPPEIETREEIIRKMSAKTQACVKLELDRLEKKYRSKFKEKFKTITMDNGSEFLDMKGLEDSILRKDSKRTVCYYAHPYSSWERGSNENQNKLIRRFVPKGSNIDKLSKKDVKRIETWMNNYPRIMFGYKSANQMAA